MPSTYKRHGLKCPRCGSENCMWYDGALGYEGISCNNCLMQTNANDITSYSPRVDPQALRELLDALALAAQAGVMLGGAAINDGASIKVVNHRGSYSIRITKDGPGVRMIEDAEATEIINKLEPILPNGKFPANIQLSKRRRTRKMAEPKLTDIYCFCPNTPLAASKCDSCGKRPYTD